MAVAFTLEPRVTAAAMGEDRRIDVWLETCSGNVPIVTLADLGAWPAVCTVLAKAAKRPGYEVWGLMLSLVFAEKPAAPGGEIVVNIEQPGFQAAACRVISLSQFGERPPPPKVPGRRRIEQYARFNEAMPADDAAIVDWIKTQPGIVEVSADRRGQMVVVVFVIEPNAREPRWIEWARDGNGYLGFADGGTARITDVD
jgi:hypothetical protein